MTPEKFKIHTGQLEDTTPAILADKRIFFSRADGNLIGLKHTDGNIGWSIWVSVPLFAPPTVAPDGVIYTMDWMGNLNAVEGKSPLAKSAWPMFRGNLRHTGVVNLR